VTRISDESKTGHAAFTVKYSIGFHNCQACSVETPEPPQEVLDGLCAKGVDGTIWPHDAWEVPGWTEIRGYGWICDRCSRAVMGLLASRGRQVSPRDQGDLARLEECARRAVALAKEAQLRDFPPHPLPYSGGEGYRYMHPARSSIYFTLDDYRQGALRERIREIEAALLGREGIETP
jgi:hypothetical protein